MMDFEYLRGDLLPLLTHAERAELKALARRLERDRGDDARSQALQTEVQVFVRKILASSA